MEGRIESNSKNVLDSLACFLRSIRKDPRICLSHIGLFTVLYHHQVEKGGNLPIEIPRNEIMEASKISSTATYFKVLNQLAEYGYIKYMPTYNRTKHSKVFIGLNPKEHEY